MIPVDYKLFGFPTLESLMRVFELSMTQLPMAFEAHAI